MIKVCSPGDAGTHLGDQRPLNKGTQVSDPGLLGDPGSFITDT